MDDFLKKLLLYVGENINLDKQSEHLLIAVSGGADSVCLLLTMLQMGYKCAVAHCNFQLRGDESDRDELFVREFCSENNVPLHVSRFDTKSYAEDRHLSIELAARRLRYEWFADIMRSNGYTALCVGHHRDDNVETLLLNLTRGTGLNGLCGMEPDKESDEFGIRIVRPLLSMSREDIQLWLKGQNQKWVNDSTNQLDCAARNVIRNQVLPILAGINPAVSQNIQKTIVNLRQAQSVFSNTIQEDIDRCVRWVSKDRDNLHLIIDRTILQECISPITVLHSVLAPLGFNTTQIRNLLNAKGYRNNRTKGVNPVRLPKSNRYLNVIVSWNEIEIRSI